MKTAYARLAAILLSLVMLLTVLPVAAFAEEITEATEGTTVATEEPTAPIDAEPATIGIMPLVSIPGTGYTFETDTGELTITTLAGTTAWREDTNIAVTYDERLAAIKSVVIDDSVNAIDTEAFSECVNLTRVDIGDSVESIGELAFFGCTSLSSVDIPDSVTTIVMYAFSNCTSLSAIVIPSGVSNIEEAAFLGCTHLSDITFESDTPPTFGDDVFFAIPSDAVITVPLGTADDYENDLADAGLDASVQVTDQPAVTFTANGVVDLTSPKDLVFTADNPAPLNSATFDSVAFSRELTGDNFGQFLDGTNFGVSVIWNDDTLTVGANAFAAHAAQGNRPLQAGPYRARITFESPTPDVYWEYYATLSMTDDKPAPEPEPKPDPEPEPTPEPEPAPEPGPKPKPPVSYGDSSSDDSGPVYVTPPVADDWLDPDEARSLAAGAKRQNQDYARTFRANRFGVRGNAWAGLRGLRFYHDTMQGGAVQVRTYFDDPALFTGDARVSGYVSGPRADMIRGVFEKWFANPVRTIHFDQAANWEHPVRVAAKLDLAGLDTAKLVIYCYDPKNNSYKKLAAPAYWIDANGYLRFTTELAGELVVSEGPLVKK